MATGYRGDTRLRAPDRLWVDLTHSSDEDENAADSANNGDGLIQQRRPRAWTATLIHRQIRPPQQQDNQNIPQLITRMQALQQRLQAIAAVN